LEKRKVSRIKKEINSQKAIREIMTLMRWITRTKSVNLERQMLDNRIRIIIKMCLIIFVQLLQQNRNNKDHNRRRENILNKTTNSIAKTTKIWQKIKTMMKDIKKAMNKLMKTIITLMKIIEIIIFQIIKTSESLSNDILKKTTIATSTMKRMTTSRKKLTLFSRIKQMLPEIKLLEKKRKKFKEKLRICKR